MKKYLIVWNGGSMRVANGDEAKERLCQHGQKDGDLFEIRQHVSGEQARFILHLTLF